MSPHARAEAVVLGDLGLSNEPTPPAIILRRRRCVAAEAVRFSIREDQIVRLLLRGLTNKEIAISLKISEKTVKNYMTILMQKLNARSRLEVVIAAQKMNECDSDGSFGTHLQQYKLS